MTVRLKLEDSRDGLVATISQRDAAGKVVGRPTQKVSMRSALPIGYPMKTASS